VWATEAARSSGLIRESERMAGQGASVLVVALTDSALDELASSLGSHAPGVCRDRFGEATVRRRLSQPGTISVALASALSAPAPGPAVDDSRAAPSHPVELLVFGRHDRRDADDAVVGFGDGLGPRARVTFHLYFGDRLLQQEMGRVKDLLERLGGAEDQPMVHRLLTRSIARAQAK